MAYSEKCRGCMNENKCDYITCRIEEIKEIRNKTIDEFLCALKKEYEPCKNKEREIYVRICNRFDKIAEQLKIRAVN